MERHLKSFAAALILLAGAATAAPHPTQQVTFYAWPPDTRVYAAGDSNGPQLAGSVGLPLSLPGAWLDQGGTAPFLLQRAGFKPQYVLVPSATLAGQDHWPLAGRIELEPDYHSRDYWVWWVLHRGPWAAAALAAMAAGLSLRRHRERRDRRVAQALLARVEKLESLHSSLPEHAVEPDFTGVTMGRWRLLERVGSGGMATVYRALPDATLDVAEPRAIKVIRRELSEDGEFQERFKREFSTCASLLHPNIVQVEEFGEARGCLFYVMEFLPGKTLRAVAHGHLLWPQEMWALMEPVMSAVALAHSKGIVHRDLKPDNVMVLDGGLVKVTDFGLARRLNSSIRVTQTGSVMGTPHYMAPEQFMGDVHEPADQYALGVMAYELLAGRLPKEAEHPMLFMQQDPVPLEAYRPDLPGPVVAAVHRMLARAPEQRYPSVAAAAKALREIIEGPEPPPASPAR
ncbi:MAG TPA: serine/threonine-protein kinase [Candidatus Xenobia bacterium]